MDSTNSEMKVDTLYAGLSVLSELSNKELPMKLAHRLTRSLKTLRTEFDIVEGMRAKLLDKYAEKDENDRPITTPLEDGKQSIKLTDPEEFRAKWTEFTENLITCAIYPIEMESLPEDFKFKAVELELLLDLGVITVKE